MKLYSFTYRYSDSELEADGAKKCGEFMVVHSPVENGDGGTVYEFERWRGGWRAFGCGRARHAHPDYKRELRLAADGSRLDAAPEILANGRPRDLTKTAGHRADV